MKTMKTILLAAAAIALAAPAHAQVKQTREQMLFYTSSWKGERFPDGRPKVPDALLNIASAQSEMGDNASARRTLEELMGKYPTSEAAGKAKQRLGAK